MSSNKTKVSAAKKARYTAYKVKDSCRKNIKRDLERHIKLHPKDKQAQQALTKNVGTTRKTPSERLGWVKEDVKSALGATVPSRSLARAMAQVLAFSRKIARISRTREEQIMWRKVLDAQKKSDSSK